MTGTERYEQILQEFVPNGTPDKDHIQQVLAQKFISWLKFEAPETQGLDLFLSTEMIVERFTKTWEPQLEYIGTHRQDEILREAMRETGIEELHRWIEKEQS